MDYQKWYARIKDRHRKLQIVSNIYPRFVFSFLFSLHFNAISNQHQLLSFLHNLLFEKKNGSFEAQFDLNACVFFSNSHKSVLKVRVSRYAILKPHFNCLVFKNLMLMLFLSCSDGLIIFPFFIHSYLVFTHEKLFLISNFTLILYVLLIFLCFFLVFVLRKYKEIAPKI